jgi:multimeric flavodoxin WrbA
MKITVFNGSPRGESGNTHIMVKAFSEGAEEAGAEVDNIFLKDKNIGFCKGCFSCWLKTPGKCVIRDDMDELLPKIPSSDIIVFAMPLYVDNVTGLMKCFMDRIIPVVKPYIEKDEKGECRHVKRHEKYPLIVVISNCGFPEQSHFQVMELLFRRIARNIHSRVIGEIYRGEGELLRNAPLIMKPLIMNYLNKVKNAGKEIVENLFLSEKTRENLEKPLIPHSFYLTGAKKSFDEKLAEAGNKG